MQTMFVNSWSWSLELMQNFNAADALYIKVVLMASKSSLIELN